MTRIALSAFAVSATDSFPGIAPEGSWPMRFPPYPNTAQEVLLAEQRGHTRYMWNLGLEQALMWRRWQGPTPGFNAPAAQLTPARAAAPWLACASHTVKQQGLRDLDQGWANFFAGARGGVEPARTRVCGSCDRRRRGSAATTGHSSVLACEGWMGLFQTQPRTGRVKVVPHQPRSVPKPVG